MKNKIGIYIHVPFCTGKCAYCDFVSFVKDAETQDRYFAMLKKEIGTKADRFNDYVVDTVFFGGGTPSLVSEKNITGIMELLKDRFSFSEDPEITIEANPNSGDINKFRAYREAGINRLSMGLQSSVDSELKALSRLHTYDEFLKCFDAGRNAGFDNMNLDIMSAIPGQSISSYEKTLERVVRLDPEHISAYSLIIEEGTPFFERYKDGRGLPTEEEDRKMYALTREFLSDYGYSRYEISNYSKAGFECRHNLSYWKRIPYVGFGIAAASLYDEKRYIKHSDLERYLKGDFSEEEETLTPTDRMEEFMFLGLRLTEGVSKEEFYKTFGSSIEEEYPGVLEKLSGQGLLKVTDRVSLTEKGMDLANYCMSEFVK